jgi:toxin ParE1/3/4
MPYRVWHDARRDLDEIFVYWAERAGVSVADRLIDGIVDRFWLLGEYPDAGRKAEDVAAGVKCFPAGKYLIYYRRARKGIDILHVFQDAREQKQAYRRSRRR